VPRILGARPEQKDLAVAADAASDGEAPPTGNNGLPPTINPEDKLDENVFTQAHRTSTAHVMRKIIDRSSVIKREMEIQQVTTAERARVEDEEQQANIS
jgi:hypothetical protein